MKVASAAVCGDADFNKIAADAAAAEEKPGIAKRVHEAGKEGVKAKQGWKDAVGRWVDNWVGKSRKGSAKALESTAKGSAKSINSTAKGSTKALDSTAKGSVKSTDSTAKSTKAVGNVAVGGMGYASGSSKGSSNEASTASTNGVARVQTKSVKPGTTK